MKILVISNTPWNTDNSFGNSFSNIFDGMDGIEFANIYCRRGVTNGKKVVKSFQITEKSLIKNLLNKNTPSGVDTTDCKEIQTDAAEQRAFDTVRRHRLRIFYILRDLVWAVGRPVSCDLKKFIDDFNPDIIFQPIYYSTYINKLVWFCKKYADVPMLSYVTDDTYSLRQFHFSPVYWLERLFKRRYVKKTVELSDILYIISDIQKREYEKVFTPPCKVLTKCADFSGDAPEYTPSGDTVTLMYAGNLSRGRVKSLGLIADAVGRLNSEGVRVTLDIYSGSPQTSEMTRLFDKTGCTFRGAVSYATVLEKQSAADIVIHVEGLSLKDRCEVHQSFSTKLVDFFEMGKCIFAVGTPDEAFAKHLLDNDAAIVASDKDKVYDKLSRLVKDSALIASYGQKSYACGRAHHDKKTIQKMVRYDLENTLETVN